MARPENVIPLSKVLHETLFTEFQGKGFLPPVLNQKDFNISLNDDGQCVSVSAGEVMQSKLNLRAMKRGEPKPPTLSIQQLVDATTPKPPGYSQAVFRYLREQGLVSAADYDVAAVPEDGARLRNVQGLKRHKISNSTHLYRGPETTQEFENALINNLMTFGPIVGGFRVTREFMANKGGIIDGDNFEVDPQTERVLTHAATIIGYGVTTSKKMYWIMRNNWGPSFGENGIFRIAKHLVSGIFSIQVGDDESVAALRRSGRKRRAPHQ